MQTECQAKQRSEARRGRALGVAAGVGRGANPATKGTGSGLPRCSGDVEARVTGGPAWLGIQDRGRKRKGTVEDRACVWPE